MERQDEVTELLADVRKGDPRAIEKLMPMVYDELRRLAAYHMQSERPDHTLQATALVHEVYLRLAGPDARSWLDRAHFFATAAQVMRNLLVDHARARQRVKRAGGHLVRLEDAPTLAVRDDENLLAIHDALDRLSKTAPRHARIVELRYFAGLSVEEAAVVLGISDRTVRREWQMAKAWLYNEVQS
ncbi:MAG: sigma-70 family RNA polymerase sigma factor [Acidobacteriia bacterium]|nr:sigma-70 family RNA polymerase sigma factor [Terriglobia bacterium]